MPQPIDVLVVDGEDALRHHLRLLLAIGCDIRLVAEMTNAHQLLQVCLERQPDVLIIGDGLKPFAFNLPALITQVSPSTKIIALLNVQDPVRTQARFFTRLQGALFRHELDETSLHGIRLVAQGNTWFTQSVLLQLGAPEPDEPPNEQSEALPNPALTRRERQILACLRRGADNAQIAAELGLAAQTVRNYVAQVCKKLGVTRNALQPPPI